MKILRSVSALCLNPFLSCLLSCQVVSLYVQFYVICWSVALWPLSHFLHKLLYSASGLVCFPCLCTGYVSASESKVRAVCCLVERFKASAAGGTKTSRQATGQAARTAV